MSTISKKMLLACFLVFPSFVFAADNSAEVKPLLTVPVQSEAVLQSVPAKAATTAAIGYVDIARIGSDSERGKTLKALLTTKKNTLQGKIEGKKKQVEKLRASIEAKIATLTPQQREAKSKEFQKKVEEFQKFAQTSEEEFYTLQEKETKSLYEAIEQSAVAHGKANGFAVIVIKKELLYVGSSVDAKDVTDDLIKALNMADQKK